MTAKTAKKTKGGKLTVYIKLEVDVDHIVPGSEAYPEQKTLRECLLQEFLWCNGKDGQGDYLDMLMQSDTASTHVTKLKYERPGKITHTISVADEREKPARTNTMKRFVQIQKRIGKSNGEVFFIGLLPGPPEPTCMYFPWDYSRGEDVTVGDLSSHNILAKMSYIGGGLKRTDKIVTASERHSKGWAVCRVCGARNGSSEFKTTSGMRVPVGANHYKHEHNIPLNLFSYPVGDGQSIYYVAEKPYVEPVKVKGNVK